MTNRTTGQANIVGDAAVASANELGQNTVEGVENVAASTGLVNPVSAHQSEPSSFSSQYQQMTHFPKMSSIACMKCRVALKEQYVMFKAFCCLQI